MHTALAFVIAAVLAVPPVDPLVVPFRAQQSPAVRDVSALIAPIRAHYDLPGMVCAIVAGEALAATGADGVRKRGGKEAITVGDKVHIGSCTKAMTATLCALLVADKKLAWDTTLRDVFHELGAKMDPGWRDVRLEQLLTNRGGAPKDLDAGGLWTKLWSHRGSPREQRMALVEGVLSRPPAASPGTKFIYSNAGFAIAGAMAERVMDKPYEELMRSRLFAPLGMQTAGFGAPGALGRVDQPRGHKSDGTPVEPGPGADNPIAIAPAGRVHCSIVDWAKFVGLHVTGEKDADDGREHLLDGAAFEKLHAPVGQGDDRYAMGWLVMEREWGGRVLMHNGSNTMWHCVTWVAPDKGFAVLVCTNQGGEKAARACDEAASALIQDQLGATNAAGKKDRQQQAGRSDG